MVKGTGQIFVYRLWDFAQINTGRIEGEIAPQCALIRATMPDWATHGREDRFHDFRCHGPVRLDKAANSSQVRSLLREVFHKFAGSGPL